MALWQNSTPLFGAAVFYMTKIDDFRRRLKMQMSPKMKTISKIKTNPNMRFGRYVVTIQRAPLMSISSTILSTYLLFTYLHC